MQLSGEFIAQSIIGVLVITDPITRGILFHAMTENEPERRPAFVWKIATVVGITLLVSAVAGKEILQLIGIDLGAFGIAGGLVVAMMGFEMLLGGGPSRVQGGQSAHAEPESFEGSVIVPYAIPFIAGPGAITMVITISSSSPGWGSTVTALIAAAVAVALLPVGHLILPKYVSVSKSGTAIFTKLGGLLVATIGVQLMLRGVKIFYGIG